MTVAVKILGIVAFANACGGGDAPSSSSRPSGSVAAALALDMFHEALARK